MSFLSILMPPAERKNLLNTGIPEGWVIGYLRSRAPDQPERADVQQWHVGLINEPSPQAQQREQLRQAVREAHAQGRTVFVDFTAAWCVTCQYNKKTVFAREDVLSAFDRKQVLTLRADWTRRDAAISAELNALGRSGVPVYAVYAPGKPPVVLSELPSASEIIAALP